MSAFDDSVLLAAARAGLFVDSLPAGGHGLARLAFERRDYQIRLAGEPDLPALEELERVSWPVRLQTSVERLRARLGAYPEGQLVLVAEERVAAVIYSQRTDVEADLTGLTMWTVETLHCPGGGQVFLLGIAVRPELQHRNFGSALLEFMLQRSSHQCGVERVAGVTRCKEAARCPQVPPEDYIRSRNELGGLVDPTLRFHEWHGAQIGGLVPGYRPEDDENQGHGVLVTYHLATRRPRTAASPVRDAAPGSLEPFVRSVAEGLLRQDSGAFSLTSPLMEMGLDSGDVLELRERINHHCGLSLETEFFFTHNTLQKIIDALEGRVTTTPKTAPERPANTGAVAIVGLAMRLPGGVDDADGFWEMLAQEKCVVGRAPHGRLTWPEGIDPGGAHRGIDQGGFLADISSFDAGLFRISRKEAELMDPQQRLLLELSWECLEHARYAPESLAGSRTGVFVGASGSDYARLLAGTGSETEAHCGLGSSMAIVPNRISYSFDFCGPSLLIDTACSSSLVALDSAVQALRAGECEQALVGGVNIICHAPGSVTYYKAGMLSPDGRCKSFDEAANGYVRAEGAAMILVKPLARALADGDRIHAVIKGSAVNHGGRANGLTVPHPGQQAALVTGAWRDAGMEVSRAGYIEAHGSATALGDPIELAGLKQAFRESSGARCAVGSVKSNLGHLEAAAGLVGLIKVVLALEHRFIPASLHFKRLNPHVSLEDSSLQVAAVSAAWPAPPEGLRCAGVSSFGSGGTNAHVVLEEAPAHVPLRERRPRHLFSRQRYWAPDRQAAPPASPTLWRRVWEEAPAAGPRRPDEERLVVMAGLGAAANPDVIELRCDSPQVEVRFSEYAARLLEIVREPMRSVVGRRLRVQVLVPDDEDGLLLTGLAAALLTLRAENGRVDGQMVVVDRNDSTDRMLARAELAGRIPAGPVVRFRGETLTVARWRAVEETGSGETPWQPEGVYLILGGAGGLGRIFASEIVARAPAARVVVAGRSPAVPPLPDRVEYRQADLTSASGVESLAHGVAGQFGRLDGILHCAGVLRDSLVAGKSPEDLRAVLAPKVHGTIHLARAVATLEKAPAFVILFGSTSGVLGNAGQFDYAAANGFQDACAGAGRIAAQRVLAIDWPLWRDGGMRADSATEASLREQWGAYPLETAAGLHAFYRAWQTGESQVLVWNGTPARIAEWPGPQSAAEPAGSGGEGNLEQRLKRVVAEVTGLAAAEIDGDRPFDAYGLDSILATELNRRLGAVFSGMSRTLLYEHDTVAGLVRFLEMHYPEESARWTGSTVVRPAQAGPEEKGEVEGLPQAEPIAIVGVSVRFPGAETLADFWRLLEAGEVAVAEGPSGRWPAAETVRWGGFLKEPYGFDPLFFGMTPREAEETDPQERLFLEECWKALEDAGCPATDLPPAVRRKTAVFGAITKQGYNLTGDAERLPVTSFASMANRVSYHFDLQGPSLPIDTMCSSALVAVHHACQYLRQGGEMALVGGANLYLHPSAFAKLEADQMVNRTECSDPFGSRGDGFIPGEGVGALVLKPLSKAERAGDAVYAVIRGAAVNHGGRSAHYTSPSARQQAAVMQDALADAGVGLETIGYLETAANGSQTGDAAEAAAISKVFGRPAESGANRYWMGSVKPNIGHPEAASGIAQIAKVCLALRHGRLPQTVLSAGFEPCVPLERLPFELIRRTEPWEPVIVGGRTCPRRAGISGVGAGGVNAHVILEEYLPANAPALAQPAGPIVLTISARTPEALQAYATAWLGYLEAHPHADLHQLAYGAQAGRSAMPCRRAIVATEREELTGRLRDLSTPALSQAAPAGVLERALAERDWSALARLWEEGGEVPWASLYAGEPMRRLHGLPVYPFARRHCAPVASTAPANRAIEFYAEWARTSAAEGREDFLTFCPFEARVPGFSMSRAFLFPEKYREEWALMKAKQLEMRQVLFHEEDLSHFDAVFDIGCGFGNDLLGLARTYPELRADGFSLTADQVKVANARIAQAGLQDRVRVWQRDSAQEAYPGRYDLVIGIEVTFHIREKDRLFANMVAALRPGGRILLMDFVTNLRGAIVEPNLEISIPTKREWIELLSRHGLELTSVIDVSPQIANFLHDPDHRANTRDLPEVVRATFQNYANQSQSLEQGWVSYCLMKMQKAGGVEAAEFARRNRAALDQPTPYPAALAAMRAHGPAPYPRAESGLVAPLVMDGLLALCTKELGFTQAELRESATFRELAVGSVEATRLTQAVNERFDLELPTSVIHECRTLGDFAAAIAARAGQNGRAPEPPKPFAMRPASLADLETWSRLEQTLLPETLVTPPQALRARIESNPGGNFLVERNGTARGCVSLRRIKSVEQLHSVNFDELPSLRCEGAGDALQLTALELPPDDSELGAEVLAWVLRLGESTAGVKSVVHIARCTAFAGRSEAEFAKYLLEAQRGGFTLEPALRNHRRQGGGVRGLLTGYRPADRANLGLGVWVQHDLRPSKSEAPPLAATNGPKAPSLSRLMKDHPEIVPLAMQGGGPLTFWLHPMSGEVGVYHKLAGQAGGEIRMIGLQARGFLRPEHRPLDSMPALARQYAEIITAVQPAGPYHLAGFSFGGTIAYEVARELQARGAAVASLLLIEAPFVSHEVAELMTMSRRGALVMNANFLVLSLLMIDSAVAAGLRSGGVDWTRYRVTDDAVAGVPEGDLLDFLVAHCRRCGVAHAAEILAKKLMTMTDVHLANLRAVQTYRTSALARPHEIRCTLLRTRDAIATSKLVLNLPYLEAIQRRYHSLSAVLEGWKTVLPHLETVVLEGGNHFELFHDEQSVQTVRNAAGEFYRSCSKAPRPAIARPRAVSGIAVIGMAGRFPEAGDVEAFWQNLATGRSSVKAVPADRGWNIDDYYDPKPQRPGKTYCRRGAFLEDVAGFDPLFFGISPLEAEFMDPSERLFLQEAWRAIEHAGYAPGRLKRRRWGVFACVKGDYQTLVQKYHPTFLVATDSTPPARLSYALDLCGPAIAIDTACSSALAAVAHACDNLAAHSCDAAVAGAGGVYVTPNMLVTSSQSLLFSPDGECYTFDERANGTVLGEAVGVVVLKRLDDAMADGDPILGVIRGWGSNQNGRTNGLTAPSALSQAALQTEVYHRHGIDPDRISLVEAHGTGTKLGDPVEYQALRESFARHTQRERFCALGSLKTNIGHPFAAAGIAGLIKVLLALQHRQIPPSLNFRKLNPLIDEAGSPFFVNTDLREWEAPDGESRMAAINSFGATGINVHLVVEEHCASSARALPEAPVVIVLSAKDRARLEDARRALLAWIRQRRAGPVRALPELRDLAYTLQVARDSMAARLAFVAQSFDDVESQLAAPGEACYGEGKPGSTTLSLPEPGAVTPAALSQVARAWPEGALVNWEELYPEGKPQRINLPGYVFARDRYWVGPIPQIAPASAEWLHPLLQRDNTSSPGRVRFSSRFSGNEFFLADHVIDGERILPGVVYLELARAAAARGMPGWGAGILCLKNVVWLRPFAVGPEGREIHVELETRDGGIAFEVYSGDPGRRLVHSQGRIEQRPDGAALEPANLELLQARCNRATLTAEQCYAAFREHRVDYGPGHRGVVQLYAGGTRPSDAEVLARLELPVQVREGSESFVLHPSLLDSALQAALGLVFAEAGGEGRQPLSLPFAIEELELHGPCVPEMWAHLRRSPSAAAGESVEKLDIALYDGAGRGLIRLRGFSSKVLGNVPAKSTPLATLLFQPVWRPATATSPASRPLPRWLIAVHPPGQEAFPVTDGVEVCRLELRDGSEAEQYAQLAAELVARIRTRLHASTDSRLLLQVALPGGARRRLLPAVSALVRTAEQEDPRLSGQVIEFASDGWPPDVLARLERWSMAAGEKQVRDDGAAGLALHWEPLLSVAAAPVWRDGGVYLITGGAGGLGQVFAREIAGRVQGPVLILAGRSPAETLDAAQLDELRRLGAIVSYEQVDVAQCAEVERLIGGIIARHGALHGVLHAAGVVRDRLIVNKTGEELAAVLAPKVAGTAHLDEATRDLPLDLFVLFSSGAGVLGNPGQADYAAANAFMDRFAEVRGERVLANERQGRTLSVNWPLWEHGGMKVSREAVAGMTRSLGIVPLRTASGLQAFYEACASTARQVLVVEGDPARIVQPGAASVRSESPSAPVDDSWREQAVAYFQSHIATLLKLPAYRVEPAESFEKYGIDSIVATALVNQLEEAYGSLPKTLFFEYQNVEALAGYFLDKYRDRTAELIGVTPGPPAEPPAAPRPAPARPVAPLPAISTEIAIIGLAGRFPGARTVAEFWENLRAGKDCVTEVPPDRWDLARHFTPDKSQLGKSYCKWGGFIDGVDLFDPLFFGIAPQIAALLDPKERLFLETVWELFESAGLTRDALEQRHAGAVGVFVGAMYQDYHAFDSTWINEAVVSLSSYSSIANRVSHFFNLQGPSVAIDTMCSSTLAAIKMACDSLLHGECEMAVAGGANLSLHPKKYAGLSLGRMLGSHPGSRSFADGDGYLPAETVGAFLLKPLAAAVRDGDRIAAVIKAVHLNHDGGSNGYGIPNPTAQAKLIEANFRRSGIDPRTIGYVEAAANGSALGDPIELAALKTAFRAFPGEPQRCVIGAVKSNIGHAEAASGVGQLAKVVLQLQHGVLVPSIKAERLNPGLSFDDSPFHLQEQTAAWPRPRPVGEGPELPRRACVSSFGAGGSNAHLIVEEYLPAEEGASNVPGAATPQVFVFSARTAERLRVHVERILAALDHGPRVSLRDLEYTLQCGREAMDSRLAFVASSQEGVCSTLLRWLEAGAAPQLHAGDRHVESPWSGLASGRTGVAWVQSLLAERDLEKLAMLWAHGASVPWHHLHPGRRPEILPLPLYPFERRICRLEPAATESTAGRPPAAADATTDWRTLLAGMLGLAPNELDDDTPLEQYGLDSILRTQFAQRVQAQGHASFSPADIRSCRTVRELLALEADPTLPSVPAVFRELVRLGKGIEPPVFWFHAGIGGVEAYEAIAAQCPRTFHGIQARGWMSDDPPLQGFAALADYYARIVQAVQPGGPYDLGGYSMGGALAYEVTRRLQQAGQTVRSIVMLDTLDGAGVGGSRPSLRALYLSVVNTLLATRTGGPGVTQRLIHRDEIPGELAESAFLDCLVGVAMERGLVKAGPQLRSTIEQIASVQRAYGYETFQITPLPRPREVEVYYVRNANGIFLGGLEPYFNLEPAVLDRSDHWQEWQAHLPGFHRIDVSSSSHMTLLMEEEPRTAILELCASLYGRKTAFQTGGAPVVC